MPYEAYATEDECAVLFPEGPEITPEALCTASRHVDALTYGRIRAAGGLGELTAFQRDAVREAVCRLAVFETENAGALESGLAAYSINGVSMRFGGDGNVSFREGVAAPGDVLALLGQTGLCGRML